MDTLKLQSTGPLYSNAVIGTLAVDGWAVTFGTKIKFLTQPGCVEGYYFSIKITNLMNVFKYLHLVQRGPTQSPPRCTECNIPPINGQCTNFILSDVAL